MDQTYLNWEMIIVDNYSDDGSWEYFQQFKADRRIHLSQAPREGMYANWNNCIREARGEYLYIATSDDTCEPELIEQMVGALQAVKSDAQHRPIDLCICDFAFIDEQGDVIDPPPRGTAREFYGDSLKEPHIRPGVLEYLLHSFVDISWTTMTAVLFRRRLLKKTGLFRTDCGPYADRFWAKRVGLLSDAVYLPHKLATWRYHDTQGSRNCRSMKGIQKKLLEIACDELEECAHLIPAEWKQDDEWRENLLWGARHRYFSSYGLNRCSLRKTPMKFFQNAGRALLTDPEFLLRRLLHGFDWQDEVLVEPMEQLQKIIDQYHVPDPAAFAEFEPPRHQDTQIVGL